MKPIHRQIHKYFEAELTPQEEKALMRELLENEGKDPVVDEALAVILASRLTPSPRVRTRLPLKRIAGIAAAIAFMITLTALLHRSPDPQTFAYVSGKKIQDTDKIKNIVATQLQDIGESTDLFSQTLSTDLNDIREALIADDI